MLSIIVEWGKHFEYENTYFNGIICSYTVKSNKKSDNISS